MADKEQTIEQRYQALIPALGRLEIECRYIIEEALQQVGIKSHSVLSRVKTLDSAREKIANKEKTDSLDDLEDLLGLRIVCLLRSDIPKIGDLIRSEFEVIAEDNKLDGANIEAFGYQSVHFVAKLNTSCNGRRYNGLHSQAFEIQLRTVSMDAWATLSHYLDYKNEADVPKELRKDFFALSGLFYLADTHFEMFYDARRKSSETAKSEINDTNLRDQELNMDTLAAYLEKKYPDRPDSPPSLLSFAVKELADSKYKNFAELDLALDKTNDAFLEYEKNILPLPDMAFTKYARMGILRVSLAMIDPDFREKIGYSSSDPFLKYVPLIKP